MINLYFVYSFLGKYLLNKFISAIAHLFSKYLLKDYYLLSSHMCSFFHLLKYLWVPHGADLGDTVMGEMELVPTLMEYPVFHLTASHKLCYFWINSFCPYNSPVEISSAVVPDLPGNNFLIWLHYWMFTSYLAQTSTKMITIGVSYLEFICTSLTNYNFFVKF